MMFSSILRRVQKLRGLPPAVLAAVFRYKAGQALCSLRQWIRVRLCGRIEPKGVRIPADGGLEPGIRFFALTDDKARHREEFARLEKELCFSLEAVRARADDACAHRFDLLGSGPVELGADIDWHRDFKAGAKWECRYFSRIPEVELHNRADIKVPWELSRFYHFVALGKAYHLTGDEKYAREFVSQFDHWTERNPPYHGVNWRLSMEVAIRAIHWIWAYFFFRDSPSFGPDTKRRFLEALSVHGDYIWHNLEFDKRVIGKRHVRQNGNHYISNLAGLVYLGIVLPGPTPKKWLSAALNELDEELRDQVLEGGVHWELSPSYHRLVLEMCLSAVVLCRLNGVQVPDSTLQRLEAMCGFTMHYTRPDGLCPMVRDADDGRLCWLNGDDFRDHRHVLALGGVFFNRPDLAARGGGALEDVLWMLGPAGVQAARSLARSKTGDLTSQGFAEAGYYVLRSGGGSHVFVGCADVGMKGSYGGHAHNDVLSFELFHRDAGFVTDCGTYMYGGDPEGRNQFRSTAFHNTARVDGVEQNRFDPAELFGMSNDARPQVLAWRSTPEFDFLRAAHFGYQRLEDPVVHQRDFFLDKLNDELMVIDKFQGRGEHSLEVFLHVSPEVRIRQVAGNRFALEARESRVIVEFQHDGDWRIEEQDGWVSERYGTKRPGRKLVLSSRRAVPAELTTRFRLCEVSEATALDGGEGREWSASLQRYRNGAKECPGLELSSH